jgi:hypothetical protein
MALQGQLETFPVDDLLRLLAATRKTGCLVVQGRRGQAGAWLRVGDLVGVEGPQPAGPASGRSIAESTFELLRFGRGTFRFVDGAQAPDHLGAVGHDVELVLRDAGRLIDEWQDLRHTVPSLDHEVRLEPELSTDRVTIDVETWAVLSAVGPGATVDELAHWLGVSELEVMRRVHDVAAQGLVTIDPPAHATAAHRHQVAS